MRKYARIFVHRHYLFREANSFSSVRVNVGSDDKGLKCYQLPQEEVDRIERMRKGGNDSDIEVDDKSVGKDAASEDEIDDHPRRVSCNREFKI